MRISWESFFIFLEYLCTILVYSTPRTSYEYQHLEPGTRYKYQHQIHTSTRGHALFGTRNQDTNERFKTYQLPSLLIATFRPSEN
jgi:hypothetical protein